MNWAISHARFATLTAPDSGGKTRQSQDEHDPTTTTAMDHLPSLPHPFPPIRRAAPSLPSQFATLTSRQIAYNPVSFCKCICFNNATIIPILNPTDKSKPCADCTSKHVAFGDCRYTAVLSGLSFTDMSRCNERSNPRRRHRQNRHFNSLLSYPHVP
jgi:hypothetical protein